MTCHTTHVPTQTLEEWRTNKDWIVFDCRANPSVPQAGREMYNAGHIPGAIYMCLDEDLSSAVTETSGRHPLPEWQILEERLRAVGVNQNSQIVVYDHVGGRIACRMWWILRHWLRHACTAVLDGGIIAWQEDGYTLDKEEPLPRQRGDFCAKSNDKEWVSTKEMEHLVETGEATIVDARSESRFRGESEPVDAKAGHIPGAINIPMDDNLDSNNLLRPSEELRDRFKGISLPVVHSCASGVTACVNILAMEVAGLPAGRLYPGSWSEWIRDPRRPIVTNSDNSSEK